jgi:hypothetical protein
MHEYIQASAKILIDDNAGVCENPANVGGLGANPPRPLLPPPTDSYGSPESESNQMPTDSLQALSKRELITLLRRKPCVFDDVDLLCLTHATAQRLKVLRCRAREGKCVEEASEFARWVLASGLLRVCEGQDKGEVRELAQDTLYDCECHWRNEGRGPWIAQSELEAVNGKLDCLAAMVLSLKGNNAEQVTVLSAPSLLFLPEPGGHNGHHRQPRGTSGGEVSR